MSDLFSGQSVSDVMPAISLWQPWASLPFAQGRYGFLKKHETRHWRYPARYHGLRVLMHAAKTKSELRDLPRRWREAVEEWPLGAFVGSFVLSGCYQTDLLETDEDDRAAGNYDPGRYAWRMTDPIKFAVPIPAKGQQGFWLVNTAELLRAGAAS